MGFSHRPIVLLFLNHPPPHTDTHPLSTANQNRKRGVFKPIRRYFPSAVAVLITFLASGILHEYILSIMRLKGGRSDRCNSGGGDTPDGVVCHHDDPALYTRNQLSFFLWNGGVLILERLAVRRSPRSVRRAMERLPSPIRTALTLMMVLPISHWFTNVYVEIGFYSDYKLGFPLVVSLG